MTACLSWSALSLSGLLLLGGCLGSTQTRCKSDDDCPSGAVCELLTSQCSAPASGDLPSRDLWTGDLRSTVPDLKDVPQNTHVWSKRFGTTGHNTTYAVVSDRDNNVIIAGAFEGAVDLGGGALQSAGAHDLFVAKYTGDGKLLWAQRFGGSGDDAAYGVTVALSGEITVAGTMQGSFSAGATSLTSAGGYDVLLLRLQPSGAPLWAQRFGSAQDDAASSVASALSGDVAVTGYFSGPASFGGNQLNPLGGADIFLARYDAAGKHQWAQRHGGPLDDFGNRVTVDPSGNVLLAGQFHGEATFGGPRLTSAGQGDGFFSRYSPLGAYQWSRRVGGAGEDIINGITVDADGNFSVLGVFTGTTDYGTGPLKSIGPADAILARFPSDLKPDSTPLWARHFGGERELTAGALATAIDGSITITGAANSTVDLGGGPLVGGGIYAARFEPQGALRWQRNYAGPGNAGGLAVAVDSNQFVLLGGDFAETLDLGGGKVQAVGAFDAYLIKLTP